MPAHILDPLTTSTSIMPRMLIWPRTANLLYMEATKGGAAIPVSIKTGDASSRPFIRMLPGLNLQTLPIPLKHNSTSHLTMSESPVNSTEVKETKVATALPEHTDLENGDKGIVTLANPLARELKGRHMQMIAIGLCSFSQIASHSGADISRWCNRCRFVCWFR